MKCKKTLSDNRKCQAYAQKGKDFCFRHDARRARLARQASRKGGQNRTLQGVYGQNR